MAPRASSSGSRVLQRGTSCRLASSVIFLARRAHAEAMGAPRRPTGASPDLITPRLLKAAMSHADVPYGREEMLELARRCTEKAEDASKVERLIGKSAAAMLLEPRIGDRFDAVVTGASPKGTWVRLLHPPVEERVVRGFDGMDVGDRVHVELFHTDVERGFIDFFTA